MHFQNVHSGSTVERESRLIFLARTPDSLPKSDPTEKAAEKSESKESKEKPSLMERMNDIINSIADELDSNPEKKDAVAKKIEKGEVGSGLEKLIKGIVEALSQLGEFIAEMAKAFKDFEFGPKARAQNYTDNLARRDRMNAYRKSQGYRSLTPQQRKSFDREYNKLSGAIVKQEQYVHQEQTQQGLVVREQMHHTTYLKHIIFPALEQYFGRQGFETMNISIDQFGNIRFHLDPMKSQADQYLSGQEKEFFAHQRDVLQNFIQNFRGDPTRRPTSSTQNTKRGTRGRNIPMSRANTSAGLVSPGSKDKVSKPMGAFVKVTPYSLQVLSQLLNVPPLSSYQRTVQLAQSSTQQRAGGSRQQQRPGGTLQQPGKAQGKGGRSPGSRPSNKGRIAASRTEHSRTVQIDGSVERSVFQPFSKKIPFGEPIIIDLSDGLADKAPSFGKVPGASGINGNPYQIFLRNDYRGDMYGSRNLQREGGWKDIHVDPDTGKMRSKNAVRREFGMENGLGIIFDDYGYKGVKEGTEIKITKPIPPGEYITINGQTFRGSDLEYNKFRRRHGMRDIA